jgi:cytidylate kinase
VKVTADAVPGPVAPQYRLVTISASYGAGGSVVAPALAERLGVPFLQRVTSNEADPAQPGPCAEQLTEEEASSTPVHRLMAAFTHGMPVGPTQSAPPAHVLEDDLRGSAEAGIRRMAADGEGVILGRAAAVVLGKDRGYHVRLDGPAERRVTQGAAIEGISAQQARARLRAADKARTAYVRRLYRADPADPALYHLVIDSTAIPLDTVIDLIVAAVQSRDGQGGL